ncbi:DUF5817 domain-containing protein [Natronobiforma cellulositropha]|uniref:DUF5817 domain-containing protein n=1 Tax=Natronobiforma cellulositropha TaxID=1679076 RepID=UPI0021D597B5|nr:DUF5817 domain-containing protein [Natronobiforma cellulositropha]
MYAVVGCSVCSHLWILEGRTETTACPRCGTRKRYEARKKFVETEDVDHAREVRASMLANRSGHGDAFARLDSVAELETQVADGVVSDEEYLEASGLDTDEIASAGERNPRQPARGGSKSEIVDRALAELERPTEAQIVEYAGERGVSAEYVERALEKLTRSGAVSESGGRYRPL